MPFTWSAYSRRAWNSVITNARGAPEFGGVYCSNWLLVITESWPLVSNCNTKEVTNTLILCTSSLFHASTDPLTSLWWNVSNYLHNAGTFKRWGTHPVKFLTFTVPKDSLSCSWKPPFDPILNHLNPVQPFTPYSTLTSLIYSLTHSLTHSFTHLLTHLLSLSHTHKRSPL